MNAVTSEVDIVGGVVYKILEQVLLLNNIYHASICYREYVDVYNLDTCTYILALEVVQAYM